MKQNIQIQLISIFILLVGESASFADEQHAKSKGDIKQTTRLVGSCKVAHRADVLLITSEELTHAWDEFATWKTKTGRPTKVVTVEEIDRNYEGADIQQKIRVCCLSHIELQQTRWVVLGGDSRGSSGGHVPDRDTDHADFYQYKNLPTDAYYLSAGDWDANDDGIYGRFADDLAAVHYTNPKASLGRIPVRTVEDVAAYTRKVIEYESEYPEGDFASRMIYTCAVEHANPKLDTSCKSVASDWTSGDVKQFFVGSSPWDGDVDGDHDLTAENWTTMINDSHAAKIHMHGHGLIRQWVLENDSMVTEETVAQLTNNAAYPLITTVSCFTGHFDAFRDPCIAESMLRKKSGGAIAIIAPAREGIPVFHQPSDFQLMLTEGKMDGTTEMLTKFWQHALMDEPNIGNAFRAAKQDLGSDGKRTDGYHFVLCELNLLGDPTLDVRSKPVTSIKASTQKIFQSGQIEIMLQADPDCEFCIWDGANLHETLKADAGGKAVFRSDQGSRGNVHIAAYAPSRNTWTSELTLE